MLLGRLLGPCIDFIYLLLKAVNSSAFTLSFFSFLLYLGTMCCNKFLIDVLTVSVNFAFLLRGQQISDIPDLHCGCYPCMSLLARVAANNKCIKTKIHINKPCTLEAPLAYHKAASSFAIQEKNAFMSFLKFRGREMRQIKEPLGERPTKCGG